MTSPGPTAFDSNDETGPTKRTRAALCRPCRRLLTSHYFAAAPAVAAAVAIALGLEPTEQHVSMATGVAGAATACTTEQQADTQHSAPGTQQSAFAAGAET
ncbi:hypothetical protein FTUN_5905 [Frigoriglobus tundricola]|uniref:Uncharacterized protein n=1 Tax=Frigoriglobus tundricola TaxID=2774151 RepID=A0A6M5YW42_9BACT|nr:hypothetical protein FTUN_5905 [Frigoriglobus tundricola]